MAKRPTARVREALRLYRRTGRDEGRRGLDLTYLRYLISLMSEQEMAAYYAGARRRRRSGL